VTASYVKLTATNIVGDNFVHLYEFTLLGPNTVDTTGPVAAAAAINPITTAGGTSTFISVNYTDASAIETSTIRTGNLRITGPNGFDQLATFYDVDHSANGPAVNATYYVIPPGGSWHHTDAGTYTITLEPAQVGDTFGNQSASTTLGQFTVDVPPPMTVPPADLTESNASQWIAWAQDGSATVSNDTTRKLFGASSIRFDTNGGFDTYLRFPPPENADWNLASATGLHFSVYAQNSNTPQFQNGSPWIILTDTSGATALYQYYQDGSPYDLLNEALNTWKTYTVPLDAGGDTSTGWRKTVAGNAPDLGHIASVEFHGDTWGYGFTLWYDGVGFDLPQLPAVSVSGSGQLIANGDTTPSRADGTDFGSVTQDQGGPVDTFVIANTGTAPLELSGLMVPPGFRVVDPLVASLAAGATDQVALQLNTGTAGDFSGTVTFSSSDPSNRVFAFRISGRVNPSPLPPPTDTTPPTSRVAPLPASSTSTSIGLTWSGQDEPGGSGIASYTIYVSDNGGPYTPWLSNTAETAGTFSSQIGHTYSFYSVARDKAGNSEPKTPQAEATTTVAGLGPPPTAAPTATDDAYSVARNKKLSVPSPGLLANDLAPNGARLTAALGNGPRKGKLTLQADGSFLYQPKRNFTGTDAFTYFVSDGQHRSNLATVVVKVGGPPPKKPRVAKH
jgi:hypothetical protein